jgi:hypothetical protein
VNGKFSCSLTRQEAHKRDQRWFTPKQRAELWECWKSGQCVADVARAEEQEQCLSDIALAPRRRAPASGVAVTDVRACPSICIPLQRVRLEGCCVDRLNPPHKADIELARMNVRFWG